MTKLNPNLYAVYNAAGIVVHRTVDTSRTKSIQRALAGTGFNWKYLKKIGFTTAQVSIHKVA